MTQKIPHRNDAKVIESEYSRTAITIDKSENAVEFTQVKDAHNGVYAIENLHDEYDRSESNKVILRDGKLFVEDATLLSDHKGGSSKQSKEYSAAIPVGMNDALKNAVDRAFKDNKLSAKESEQFDNVRAMIGSSVKNDSQIDASETKAIISALNNIASSKGQGR